jgi:hypothetical protein
MNYWRGVNASFGNPILCGVDFDGDTAPDECFKRMEGQEETAEFCAYLAAGMLGNAKDALAEHDAPRAAWAMACAERFRSMWIVKENFEEVVWMGHSAARVINLLRLWDANKDNATEEFWQAQMKQYAFAISQIFSMPITFIQDKAYVGGQGIDRRDARLVDFLFSKGASGEALLLEIKTPCTKLLGSKYRTSVYKPSAEVVGATVQALDYKNTLISELTNVVGSRPVDLSTINPRCLVLAGRYDAELTSAVKRRSFELFRSHLTGVEIITFDEFFRKIETLAELFSLKRTKR